MIRLNCTNCKTLLTMDDAFAGGVCRCQHCGTIQTVPSSLKGADPASAAYAAQAPRASVGSAKPLYRKAVRPDGTAASGTGLDALADAVATSSGLGGSGLGSGRMRKAAMGVAASSQTGPQAQQNKLLLMLGGAAVVIVVLLGVVIFLMMRNGGQAAQNTAPANAINGDSPIPPEDHHHGFGPRDRGQRPPLSVSQPPSRPPHVASSGDKAQLFCGVKITEPIVIYVLDRGQGTSDLFDYLRVVSIRSIESLKPHQKFQIIFWSNSAPNAAFPESGPAAPTPQTIDACRNKLDDITAFGQSDVKTALKKAIAENASVIVLASGKWLDDDFAKEVLDVRGNSRVKINTFGLGQTDASSSLKEIAAKTGGTYKDVSKDQLQDFAE